MSIEDGLRARTHPVGDLFLPEGDGSLTNLFLVLSPEIANGRDHGVLHVPEPELIEPDLETHAGRLGAAQVSLAYLPTHPQGRGVAVQQRAVEVEESDASHAGSVAHSIRQG